MNLAAKLTAAAANATVTLKSKGSGGTAGGVAPATDNVLTEIGEVMAVSANTEYSLVWMNIQ